MRVPAHLSSSAKIVQSDQLPSCADRVLPMCQVHLVHAYEQQYSPTHHSLEIPYPVSLYPISRGLSVDGP